MKFGTQLENNLTKRLSYRAIGDLNFDPLFFKMADKNVLHALFFFGYFGRNADSLYVEPDIHNYEHIVMFIN